MTLAVLGSALLAAVLPAQEERGVVVAGHVRNGGSPLSGAVVYLLPVDDTLRPEPDPPVIIDQRHLSFIPDVAVVTPGTEVRFMNSDEVLHNVFSPGLRSREPFDLGTYARTDLRAHRFMRPGVHVILCHIHPEMVAFVLVVRTPHKVVTGADGSWRLEGVPPGRYVLHGWHARHWRDELTDTIRVGPAGVDDLLVTLGRDGGVR